MYFLNTVINFLQELQNPAKGFMTTLAALMVLLLIAADLLTYPKLRVLLRNFRMTHKLLKRLSTSKQKLKIVHSEKQNSSYMRRAVNIGFIFSAVSISPIFIDLYMSILRSYSNPITLIFIALVICIIYLALYAVSLVVAKVLERLIDPILNFTDNTLS